MDPGVGDAVDHLDALGQLVLLGPGEVDVLHEGTDADLLIVEELVAALLADGQALLGQVQPKLVDVLARDVDRGAAVAQLVGDRLLGDLLRDLGGLRRAAGPGRASAYRAGWAQWTRSEPISPAVSTTAASIARCTRLIFCQIATIFCRNSMALSDLVSHSGMFIVCL
jgi:hypothetical protein